jgi:hypothetical protein
VIDPAQESDGWFDLGKGAAMGERITAGKRLELRPIMQSGRLWHSTEFP